MSIKQILRFCFTVCLCCLVFFNINIRTARAESLNVDFDYVTAPFQDIYEYLAKIGSAELLDSTADGFFSGFGHVAGGIAGATAACYITNAVIVPIAPPVAGALVNACPFVGGAAGSLGGGVATKTVAKKAVKFVPTKLIPALF